MSREKKTTRRTVIKQVSAVGTGIFGVGKAASIASAAPRGPDEDDNTDDPGGGGDANYGEHSIARSAESNFMDGSGVSYTAAGSSYNILTNIPEWDSSIGKYRVNVLTTSVACTGYELENGSTGHERLYRGQHRLIVNHDYSNQISTQAYDDAEWGISTISDHQTGSSPGNEIADSVYTLLSGFGDFIPTYYEAIDLYNRLNQAYIDGEIDKTWLAESTGQSRMGHIVTYRHVYPPREVLGTDSVSVSVRNKLHNSIYEPETDWTGNREPTDVYDHTHEYDLYVPYAPADSSVSKRN
ncbi:hypothetical protein [Haloarchaeobius iranensis]|nr:hypothetical protein [Haloarchaeobius iranensis]